MNKKQISKEIYEILLKKYPSPKSALNFSNEVEVWASVILSAQCTDKRVNIVTKELFKKYKSFKDYKNSDIEELKKIIHSTGFFNSKAKFLKDGATILVDKYSSKLPKELKELIKLPGVGRKVANVILSEQFQINEGMAIDTHNKRVIHRIGLTKSKDPKVIEKEIVKILDKKNWNTFSLLMIEHGRETCKAIKPRCNKCEISKYCSFYRKNYIKKV